MINNTLLAIPTGSKQMHLLKTGEEVLAGSAHLTNGKLELTWEASEVSFSSGTDAASSQSLMVYVEMKGTQEVLGCDPQQPVLLADGNYTIADKLRPGLCLVDKEGKSVPLGRIRMGQYRGGVHAIATGAPWKDSPSGHLLLANGVVVGDFTMQLYFDQLPGSMKEGDFNAKPGLGTPEDSAAYPPRE